MQKTCTHNEYGTGSSIKYSRNKK